MIRLDEHDEAKNGQKWKWDRKKTNGVKLRVFLTHGGREFTNADSNEEKSTVNKNERNEFYGMEKLNKSSPNVPHPRGQRKSLDESKESQMAKKGAFHSQFAMFIYSFSFLDTFHSRSLCPDAGKEGG